MWRSGDLREKLVALNAKISRIRARWQVRGTLIFRSGFRRRIVLTAIAARRDCKSAHSYRPTWSFLLRPKRQRCSNKYSPCSNRGRSGSALVLFQCTPKSNPMASIARRPGWATIRAGRALLMGVILRSSPTQPNPSSPSPYYPLTLPFHMIVSSFVWRNTAPSLHLTRIRSSFQPRMARLSFAESRKKQWDNF